MLPELLKAILVGIIEGVSEWLPISSTGHMILLDEFIRLELSDEFLEMFLMVIQLGAILAVPILYFSKLNPFSKIKNEAERKSTLKLWSKVLIGVTPAAIVGILLDDIVDAYLYHHLVVAAALIIYGIAFIIVERTVLKSDKKIESIDDLSYADALKIGAFQTLSIIPGTSRSGSTILGGLLVGVTRECSAEFSFFMAIPIMLGASVLKIVKFMLGGFSVTAPELLILIVGMSVAFLISLVSIRFLVDFVKRHTFVPFGIYRIVLGIITLAYFLI